MPLMGWVTTVGVRHSERAKVPRRKVLGGMKWLLPAHV